MKRIKRKQAGITLIEVLVTVLLLATALLLMAALQIRSLQFNKGAYFRSQANILAYDIIDRMRLNRTYIGSYNVTLAAANPTIPASGSTGQINAPKDIVEWRTLLSSTLPGGKGGVQCNNLGVCTITIQWSDVNSSGDTSEDTSTFIFHTQV